MSFTVLPAAGLLDQLTEALSGPGYLVLDDVLPNTLFQDLRNDCLENRQGFRTARLGRGGYLHVDSTIRTDEINWLETGTAAVAAYLGYMDALRSGLNSRLYLGLFDYECHFARYVPGSFYRTHLDAFTGTKSRVLSTVFYLNEGWIQQDGGELLLYAEKGGEVLEQVLPQGNRLVVFLSERFPHEVLVAQRERYSVAGWFRVKGEKSWLRPV
jgi:SM-20-related protein